MSVLYERICCVSLLRCAALGFWVGSIGSSSRKHSRSGSELSLGPTCMTCAIYVFGQVIDGAKWLGATADDTITVCACLVDISGELLTGTSDANVVPTINHFVIAIPVPGMDWAPPMPTFRATARGLNARAAALQAGYALLDTVANGDCGLDTMLYFLGRDRSTANMKALRRSLADGIETASWHNQWRTAFMTCQEMPTGPPPPSAATSDSAPSATATSGSAPSVPPGRIWGRGGRAKGRGRGGAPVGAKGHAAPSTEPPAKGGMGPPLVVPAPPTPTGLTADPPLVVPAPPMPTGLTVDPPLVVPAPPTPTGLTAGLTPTCLSHEPPVKPVLLTSLASDVEIVATRPLDECPVPLPDAIPLSPAQPTSFMQWFRELDAERRGAICHDYHSFKEAHVAWLEKNPRLKRCFQKQPSRRQYMASTVAYAHAVGSHFLYWEKTLQDRQPKPNTWTFPDSAWALWAGCPRSTRCFWRVASGLQRRAVQTAGGDPRTPHRAPRRIGDLTVSCNGVA